MQGVKGSAHWMVVVCPTCDARAYERCQRDGRKIKHPHRTREVLAAGEPILLSHTQPLPGYEVELDDDRRVVLIAYEDSLLPIGEDRASKAALRAARKAWGMDLTVRESPERAPIDWATAQPCGVLYEAVKRA